MDYKKRNGQEYIAMDSLGELSALKTIVNAFSRFSHSRHDLYSTEAREMIANTAHVVSSAEFKMTQIRDEVRRDAAGTQQFKNPYIKPILAAVAMFEQRPELLDPHMTVAQFEDTQLFFPPDVPKATTT